MKKGYSLVELLVAVAIFAFMSLALSGVFATANRFFSHQYREDVLKTRFLTAMKYIQNRLMTSNYIIFPSANNVSNSVLFLSDVVVSPASATQMCRPLPASQPRWHYICLNGNNLYYHWNNIIINTCPNYSNVVISNPPTSCQTGTNAVFLSDNISSAIFSRQNLPLNIIRVNITLFSQAKGNQASDAGIVGRDITQTFETYLTVNKPNQF